MRKKLNLPFVLIIIYVALITLFISCKKDHVDEGSNNNGIYAQQGDKLSNSSYPTYQGSSVSLSANGNTLIFSEPEDDYHMGATWVYTRVNGTWTKQGDKLVGSGASGRAHQSAVAISSDGNTILIGGSNDSSIGAAWVFTQINGVWVQQGNKLISTGGNDDGRLGQVVALSSDGNTAVVGGFNRIMAPFASVFTRINGVWTQQGGRLVGSEITDPYHAGNMSVSVSGDGNTFIIGGSTDNNETGAAWVFIRNNGVWTQQGGKLVGTGASGKAKQGGSVSISNDGNTAIVGGPADNNSYGAAWVFKRTNGTWNQQGNKLVGSGSAGNAGQGYAVSLSADGNTAVVGGLYDNSSKGAIWIFTQNNGVWSQQSTKLVGANNSGASLQGQAVSMSGDGSTIAVGGSGDDNHKGAIWIFNR